MKACGGGSGWDKLCLAAAASVVSDSVRCHRWQPTRLHCSWSCLARSVQRKVVSCGSWTLFTQGHMDMFCTWTCGHNLQAHRSFAYRGRFCPWILGYVETLCTQTHVLHLDTFCTPTRTRCAHGQTGIFCMWTYIAPGHVFFRTPVQVCTLIPSAHGHMARFAQEQIFCTRTHVRPEKPEAATAESDAGRCGVVLARGPSWRRASGARNYNSRR